MSDTPTMEQRKKKAARVAFISIIVALLVAGMTLLVIFIPPLAIGIGVPLIIMLFLIGMNILYDYGFKD